MRTVVPQPFPDPTVRDAAGFGRAVRAARTLGGIRLEDAASALGISKQTLADIEKGTGTVALGTALRVARDMGVALLVAPRAAHLEAAQQLQMARAERPRDWGGPNPDDLPPDLPGLKTPSIRKNKAAG
jgi:transcriptional regulator with XRE-family HTH domain